MKSSWINIITVWKSVKVIWYLQLNIDILNNLAHLQSLFWKHVKIFGNEFNFFFMFEYVSGGAHIAGAIINE